MIHSQILHNKRTMQKGLHYSSSTEDIAKVGNLCVCVCGDSVSVRVCVHACVCVFYLCISVLSFVFFTSSSGPLGALFFVIVIARMFAF